MCVCVCGFELPLLVVGSHRGRGNTKLMLTWTLSLHDDGDDDGDDIQSFEYHSMASITVAR